MQPIRGVDIKHLQLLHVPDFGRNACQIAAIKTEFFDASQSGNRCWKGDDLDPILPVNLRPGFKDLVTVACTSLNYVEQLLPGIASRVLDSSMKLELAPALVVVLRIEARAQRSQTGSGYSPLRCRIHADELEF